MEAAATFAVASDAYARARPTYPEALFDWIAGQCTGHGSVWDCATGNGQAAFSLAKRFDRVEATDISAEQLAQAHRAANIRYALQPAERTDFPDAQFDAVTVAQALHWFDFARFWPEVRRVTRPGGLFCAWGYGGFEAEPRVREAFVGPVLELLAPFWAAENQILWRGYRPEEVGFPLEVLPVPGFDMTNRYSARGMVDYLRTWSAHKRADATAARRLAALEADFMAAFPDEMFETSTPLVALAGRVG